jgi:hypothetical protein
MSVFEAWHMQWVGTCCIDALQCSMLQGEGVYQQCLEGVAYCLQYVSVTATDGKGGWPLPVAAPCLPLHASTPLMADQHHI